MKKGISLVAVGHASSLLLAITFTLCVVFDLVFPEMAMYQMWLKLLPGFEWLTWQSFLLGLVGSVPFIYTAIQIYIWDRDLGFRKNTFTYWVIIWGMFPAFGILEGVYCFVRLME